MAPFQARRTSRREVGRTVSKLDFGWNPKDEWVTIRTIWPYKEGWGVYNPKRRTCLETGLPTEAEARAICNRENAAQA